MQLSKKTIPTLVELTTVSNYKHTNVIRHYGSLTLEKALTANSPSVMRLTKQIDRQEVINAIAKVFIATAQYFDGDLTASKANLVAEEILGNYEYSAFRLEDIVAICRELKEEAVYTKLTPSKILKHIAEYNNRRIQQSIRNNMNKTKDKTGDLNLDERLKQSIIRPERLGKIVDEKRILMDKKYYK